MEKRIKPWVTKKIVEYIGEEEPTLTDFICTSIMSKKSAETILSDIRVVLDDEAEVFVVKMWRLIVYEIEAKRNGLNK
jgi:RNA-binding protein 25